MESANEMIPICECTCHRYGDSSACGCCYLNDVAKSK